MSYRYIMILTRAVHVLISTKIHYTSIVNLFFFISIYCEPFRVRRHFTLYSVYLKVLYYMWQSCMYIFTKTLINYTNSTIFDFTRIILCFMYTVQWYYTYVILCSMLFLGISSNSITSYIIGYLLNVSVAISYYINIIGIQV